MELGSSIKVVFDYDNDEIEDIRRCLNTLLLTPEGTCPLDRSFGINAEFVGYPGDVAKNLYAVEITEKINKYEPRAIIKQINIEHEEGMMKAEVIITNG